MDLFAGRFSRQADAWFFVHARTQEEALELARRQGAIHAGSIVRITEPTTIQFFVQRVAPRMKVEASRRADYPIMCLDGALEAGVIDALGDDSEDEPDGRPGHWDGRGSGGFTGVPRHVRRRGYW